MGGSEDLHFKNFPLISRSSNGKVQRKGGEDRETDVEEGLRFVTPVFILNLEILELHWGLKSCRLL